MLTLSFFLLTLAFRSIAIPLTAIAVNLLSVGAAYGILVLVFQEGVGADLLGFTQVERIDAWVPIFLFRVSDYPKVHPEAQVGARVMARAPRYRGLAHADRDRPGEAEHVLVGVKRPCVMPAST